MRANGRRMRQITRLASHPPIEGTYRTDSFLNAPEAAAWLRVSPVTLARWRIEGRGPPHHRFGRRVTYSLSDLIAWADAQRRQSTSEPDESSELRSRKHG